MKDRTIEKVLSDQYEKFSDLDKQIAKYFLKNKESMLHKSISQVAKESYVSVATVHLFTKKLGFSGFVDFKYSVVWPKDSGNTSNFNIDIQALNKNISNAISEILEEIPFPLIDEAIFKIKESNHIYMITTGLNQQCMMLDLQQQLLHYNINSTILSSNIGSTINSEVIKNISEKDVIVAFSASGENKIVKDFLNIPITIGATIISFTNESNSWLGNNSNILFTIENSKISVDNNNSPLLSCFFHCIIPYITHFLYVLQQTH